ncbi:phospholipid/cholesterol/gamma-HCH transport system substrate-binding protein [Thermomonospora echinospora]|uniref:Phospholipid/cholesterol/gamma-HCH transport system substrate-binding protein n=1 Tax=Thermomonospora echinospora TaxID=1992 RepID=A0A1H6D9S8_9ACTN|nr:MlaD family protein [Thermomonospora echinospora]SEG81445.1 phospholipid/cholesterol/gamma-HCH transport system substrate-binding protein [Thermomonospora echinospora]
MALKSFRDRNPAVVGVASLAAIALALVTVFLTGSLGLLEKRYTVTGVFAGTGGLHSGNEVRVAGVKVGEVTAVEPDFTRGIVLITWKVDHGVDLGPQTRAEITTANILGGRYLRLGGPVARPYLADLPEERRRIPQQRTRLPVTANDVVNSGATTLRQLDAKLVGDVIDKLGGISPQTRQRLTRALHDLARLADAVQESGPQLRELVSNSNRLLSLVRTKDAQLVRLARSIQALLDRLRDRQAELSVLLGSGSSAVTRISHLIDTQQQGLIDLMDDLSATVTRLTPRLDDMNTMLTWMGPALSGFASSNSYGPWVDAVGTQIGPLAPEDLARLAEQLGGGR